MLFLSPKEGELEGLWGNEKHLPPDQQFTSWRRGTHSLLKHLVSVYYMLDLH